MSKVFKKIRSFAPVAVSAGLVLALLMGSVVPAKAAGQRVIKIGYVCAFTGPLATTSVPVSRGMLDYVRWLNDEKGGINGIKVQAMWEDYGGAAPRTIPIHKRMAQAGVVFEVQLEEGALLATLPRMVADEMPGMYVAGGAPVTLRTKPQWIVGSAPEFENVYGFIAKWMRENWTERRPMRLGWFAIDCPSVRELYHNLVPSYMNEIGVEHVGLELAPIFGVIDTTVEWLRLAAKKPDWIMIEHAGASVAVMIKDAARLGLQQKGIRLMSGTISLQEEQIKEVGEEAAEGWYRANFEPTPVTYPDCPMMKTVLDAARRYRGLKPEDVGLTYFKGWIASAVACEGVRLAVEEVGLENLTGRAVRDAVFGIRDFDTGLVAPITMTEDTWFYNRHMYFVRVEKGKFVRLTDWIEVPLVFHHVVIDGEVHTERVK